MGDLDNGTVDLDKALEGHDIAEGSEKPRKNVRRRDVREKRIRLHHGVAVDSK